MNVHPTPVPGAASLNGKKPLKPPAGRNTLPGSSFKSTQPQKPPSKSLMRSSAPPKNSPPKSKSSSSTSPPAALPSHSSLGSASALPGSPSKSTDPPKSSPPQPPVARSSPPPPSTNLPPKSKPSATPLAGRPLRSNPGSTSGRSAGGRPTPTASMEKMRRWIQGHRPRICRLTIGVAFGVLAVALLILVHVRKDLVYPTEMRPGSRLLCTRASQRIRASLDYAFDPCEDFYSFVCGAGDRNASERGSPGALFGDGGQAVWEEVQRVLESIAWHNENQGAENKAARFYRSCRRFIAAPSINVKEHAPVLFETAPELSAKTLQAALDSPAQVLDLLVSVSVKRGISALFFFRPGNGTTAVTGLRPPLSVHLDELSLHRVLLDVAAILDIPNKEATEVVTRLLLVDYELRIASSGVTPHLSRESFYAASGGNQTKMYGESETINDVVRLKSDERDGRRPIVFTSRDHDIIGTFLPAEKYTVEISDLRALRRLLRALFMDMSKTEVAIYLLTYTLLPEELLLVFANRKEKTICYRLLEYAYRDVWGDLATLMLLAESHTGAALFITEVVLATLRNSLIRRGAHNLTSSTRNTIAELLLEVSRYPDALNWTALNSLKNTNVRSLYGNVIGLSLPRGPQSSAAWNGSTVFDASHRSLSATMRIPRERLVPPFFCHGKSKFLNYATFGVSVAREALGILGGSFLGTEGGHTPTNDVKSCFANSSASLDQSVSSDRKLLDELTSWAAGYQVALAASELERSMPQHREVVGPATMQMFFARYCYHLCRARNWVFPTDEVRRPDLACNVAVMNSPKFAELFNCKRGQALFMSEHCSVLGN